LVLVVETGNEQLQ